MKQEKQKLRVYEMDDKPAHRDKVPGCKAVCCAGNTAELRLALWHEKTRRQVMQSALRVRETELKVFELLPTVLADAAGKAIQQYWRMQTGFVADVALRDGIRVSVSPPHARAVAAMTHCLLEEVVRAMRLPAEANEALAKFYKQRPEFCPTAHTVNHGMRTVDVSHAPHETKAETKLALAGGPEVQR